jgi:hypothetical protein
MIFMDTRRGCILIAGVLAWAIGGMALAQEKDRSGRHRGDAAGLRYHLSVRTPEQIAAFYEGRGFSHPMIEALSQVCFVTVGLRNDRRDIVWLALDKWRFITADGSRVPRFDRNEWNARWEKLAVPLANRATFGWTQLPEVRDLNPAEPVGGNVTLVPPVGEFRLEARFQTGADKKGKELVIRVSGLTCPGRKGAEQ